MVSDFVQDSNIILAHTYEYRKPSSGQLTLFLRNQFQPHDDDHNGYAASASPINLDGTASRYLGLIVVPGKHIVRIELEQFSSQLRKTRPISRPMPRPMGAGMDVLPIHHEGRD